MSQDKSKLTFNLWAIILAGGPNSRRGATGKQIPTIYQPIGLEPVINCSVSACLKKITPQTGRVIILTRKKHPKLTNIDNTKVDLQNWAKGWQQTHFPDNSDIDIWYEEEASLTSKSKVHGSCIALAAFLELLKNGNWSKKHTEAQPPTHVLIVAGDNYFDDDLEGMKDWVENNPEVGAVAIREIDESAEAAGRFGVVQIDSQQIIRKYQEKPKDPNSNIIAPAIYCLPLEQLQKVNEYVSKCLKNTDHSVKNKIGPPGYFIEYLVSSNTHLRAVNLPGTWVNVGTETGYLSSIIQLTTNLLRQPKSAKELYAMGDALSLYPFHNKIGQSVGWAKAHLGPCPSWSARFDGHGLSGLCPSYKSTIFRMTRE